MTGKSPAQAAYEANVALGEPSPAWDVLTVDTCEHWKTVADAAIDAAANGPLDDLLATANAENERLAAELEQVRQAAQTLGMVVTRHGRTMQAAWIDLVRGDPAAAQETLGVETEGVPELHTWNGTETGAEWLRRTEAEEP